MLRTAFDTDSIYPTRSQPTGFAAVLGGAGGVWGAAQTYGYKITTLTALGESAPADEITFAVTDTTKRVELSWAQVPSATGYKIYRTATPGTYGATTLLTTIGSGATITFSDTGAATTTGTPPSANTTGGWAATAALGAPASGGVWPSTGIRFWRVIARNAAGTELANSLEATVNVDNVTKKVTVSWPAFAGAASFDVYRSTVTGEYPSPALVATGVTGTFYDDTGTATVAGAMTTAISYGVPPNTNFFGTVPLTLGSSIPIGQVLFFWMNTIIPAGTPEEGNRRQATIFVREV